MRDFKIKYKYYNKKDMEKRLKTFKKEGDRLDYTSTFAYISIYLDKKLVQTPWAKEKLDFTDTEWLWDLCLGLTKVNEIFDSKEKRVLFTDDPLDIVFQKVGNNVRVGIATRDSRPYVETILPLNKFLESVYAVLNNFVEEMDKINLDLRKSPIFTPLSKTQEWLEAHVKEGENHE